jgi:hypothetical protein
VVKKVAGVNPVSTVRIKGITSLKKNVHDRAVMFGGKLGAKRGGK